MRIVVVVTIAKPKVKSMGKSANTNQWTMDKLCEPVLAIMQFLACGSSGCGSSGGGSGGSGCCCKQVKSVFKT